MLRNKKSSHRSESLFERQKNVSIRVTQTPYLLVATFTPTPIVEVTVQDFR